MASEQGINAILIEELREMKIAIDEKKNLKEKRLNDKNSLKKLTLTEVKELQRKVKGLIKQLDTQERKRVLVRAVVEHITITNEVIELVTDLAYFSREREHMPVVLETIERDVLVDDKRRSRKIS